MIEANPKIIHRIYFPNYAPFYDPFEHYLETWRREMPDYEIKIWNASNLDVEANAWTRIAAEKNSPVFLSEYFRWQVLSQYGGLYLDADCEILNGAILGRIVDDLYTQAEYDTFFGVEERTNGHPTAQTVGARQGSDLVRFMKSLYEDRLPPFWSWRERRGLIGPQLMALYFLDKDINVADDGFFKHMDNAVVRHGCKVYPQAYFSPKFTLMGDAIDFVEDRTCLYHMFANSNVDFTGKPLLEDTRRQAKTFSEYREMLHQEHAFPRRYSAYRLSTQSGQHTVDGLVVDKTDGLLSYGPYVAVPEGSYTAAFRCTAVSSGSATVTLLVTEQDGRVHLAERTLVLPPGQTDDLTVPFVVAAPGARRLEVVVKAEGLDCIVIRELVIDVRAAENNVAQGDAGTALEPSEPPRSLKTIHRIYFGFDGKPDAFARYLETWREQLPDFEIRNWDASNLPMDINPYVQRLYAERDHAFLTDYFRWYVLREFGGIYFDGDVEVVDGSIFREIVVQLADAGDHYDAVIGIDEKGGGWYTAHTMAARAGARLPTYMCDVYDGLEKLAVWRKKAFYLWAPQLTAVYFAESGHNYEGMGTSPHLNDPIVACHVKIYPQSWFAPLAPTGDADRPFVLNALSRNTCLCHHFACTWHAPDSFYQIYSAESGGQTNILLQEIIDRAEPRHYPAATLPSGVGRAAGTARATDGRAGTLAFGPYVTLPAGAYRGTFILERFAQLGSATIDVACDKGETTLANRPCNVAQAVGGRIGIAFELTKMGEDVEVRLHVDERSDFTIAELVISRDDGEGTIDALPPLPMSAHDGHRSSGALQDLVPKSLYRWIGSLRAGRR